jgi:hypothetical protein
MKVGKIPVASIILLLFMVLGFVMKRVANGQYALDPHFINGAICGAAVVWGLYYVNIFYKAWANNKKETKNNSAS